jgi:hypothetical protein
VLNAYRGLQTIDVSDPSNPTLLGQAQFYGNPVELYIRDRTAYVVVSDYWTWWACNGADCPDGSTGFRGSQVHVVDVSNLNSPVVTSKINLHGEVTDSRIVGDVLYVVSNEYSYYNYGSQQDQDLTYVASINIADKHNVQQIDRLDFPRQGWDNHINVSQNALFVASPAYGYWDGQDECPDQQGCTKITYVDISDPAGTIAQRSSRVLLGYVSDRWSMDFDTQANILRVVTSDAGWSPNPVGPTLRTLQVGGSAMSALGSLTIPLTQPEQTTSVRFDGDHVYLGTFQNVDPLYTIDVTTPQSPVVMGQLQTSGWLDFIEPRGDRLIALGHAQDPQSGTWRLQVSMYNVADLTQPSLMQRRIFGGDWGWTPGSTDDFQKVFKVLDDQGLILVPYTSWEQAQGGWWYGRQVGNVQLLDFDHDTLTLRGNVKQNGYTQRALTLGEKRLLALSDQGLDVLNISDRQNPRLEGTLELARNVADVALTDSVAIEYVGDWYSGTSQLVVTSAGDPNATRPYARLSFPYPQSRIYRNGQYAYVVSQSDGFWGWAEDAGGPARGGVASDAAAPIGGGGGGSDQMLKPKVTVVDLADPRNPVIRGQLDLPVDYIGWCGGFDGGNCGWWGWGDQLVQLDGGLLALKQDSQCTAWDQTTYECTNLQPAQLYVLDLNNADSPRIASSLPFDDADWISGLAAQRNTVYLTHVQSYQNSAGDWFTRYYLDRVDVSDESNPVLLPRVNIPGQFVGATADNSTIYTLEYWYDNNNDQTYLHALTLDQDRAYLQSSLTFQGSLYGIQIDGSGYAYTTVYDWQNQTSTETQKLVTVDLRDSTNLQKAEQVLPGSGSYWWYGDLTVAGSRLFVNAGEGMLVYDLSNPLAPAFTSFHRTHGWASRVVVQGSTAFVPTGYYGVETFQLQ